MFTYLQQCINVCTKIEKYLQSCDFNNAQRLTMGPLVVLNYREDFNFLHFML